jgi:hypothetical protein
MRSRHSCTNPGKYDIIGKLYTMYDITQPISSSLVAHSLIYSLSRVIFPIADEENAHS